MQVLLAFLEEKPKKKKFFDEVAHIPSLAFLRHGSRIEEQNTWLFSFFLFFIKACACFFWQVGAMSEFIVDDIIDDEEEEEDDESNYNHFESLCAICDDGGELLWYVLSHSIKKTLMSCLCCIFVESALTYLNYQLANCYLIRFSLLYDPVLMSCFHPDKDLYIGVDL